MVWRCPGGPHGPCGLTLKVSADLVLLNIRKSTFQHFTADWNFNVLEMTLKTFHFVQGLSRTPLLFIPRYLTNIFFKKILQRKHISRIKNPKIWKFQNPGSLTGAQFAISVDPGGPTNAPHTRTDLLLTWPCKRVAVKPYMALQTCSRSTFTWNNARVDSENKNMTNV